MKIGDSNFNTNIQPENLESIPDGLKVQQQSVDSLEGPTGQVQQELHTDHDPNDPSDFSQDFNNGAALLLGGGIPAFGIAFPLAAIAADPGIMNRLGDMMDSAFDWVGGGISSLGHDIGGVFGDGLDWLGGVISDTPEAIGDAINWTEGALVDAANATGDAISDGASAVVEGAADAVEAVGGAVSDAVSTVCDW